MKIYFLRYCFSVALLGLTAMTAQAEQRVYLLARVAVENSTYGQAAFFYDREVGDVAACEQDIVRGNRGQWQYYGHYVRKAKGLATTISYSCIATDLSISEWVSTNRYSYTYLIDRRTNAIKVQSHENYADCLTVLRKTQKAESDTFYCAKFNQRIGPAEQE